VKRFPGAQLGPAQQHYDLGAHRPRDIAWFFHGGTPGAFPLTERPICPIWWEVPYAGARVLNDPELRQRYLDRKHKGVESARTLHPSAGAVHSVKEAVKNRSPISRAAACASRRRRARVPRTLGATPVGVAPTEMVEQLRKGAIDGVMIDYGGAGIAFRMGGHREYTTELQRLRDDFGLAMNEEVWRKLAPNPTACHHRYDRRDAPRDRSGVGWHRRRWQESPDGCGTQVWKLAPEDEARARRAGARGRRVAPPELEAKGLPARQVYKMMKSIAERRGPAN